MRVKVYRIEAPGRLPEHIRGTARVAQRRVRELHQGGIPATLRTLTNRAEARAALAEVTA